MFLRESSHNAAAGVGHADESLHCRDGGSLTWAAKPSVRKSPDPASKDTFLRPKSPLPWPLTHSKRYVIPLAKVHFEAFLWCHLVGRAHRHHGSKKVRFVHSCHRNMGVVFCRRSRQNDDTNKVSPIEDNDAAKAATFPGTISVPLFSYLQAAAIRLLLVLVFVTRDVLLLQWCMLTWQRRCWPRWREVSSEDAGRWMMALLTPVQAFDPHVRGLAFPMATYAGLALQSVCACGQTSRARVPAPHFNRCRRVAAQPTRCSPDLSRRDRRAPSS